VTDDGAAHKFSVPLLPQPGEDPSAWWAPPPACPQHPGSKVIRFGKYGDGMPQQRQRYRCTPGGDGQPHVFTPPLPRAHVHEDGERCEHCESMRGVHHGDVAVARRHTWPLRLVVRGLEMLAKGESYAQVGVWALRATGTQRTRRKHGVDGTDAEAEPETSSAADDDPFVVAAPVPDDKTVTEEAKKKPPPSSATKVARNAWRIGAEWVTCFGPVVWDSVDAQLRDVALAERARLDALKAQGRPLTCPQVVLVDDVPVYGRDLERRGKLRRDKGFYVLAAAETHWSDGEPTGKLRLARTMAKSNTAAWVLVFDELGYEPDYIVADAGTGISAAIDHFYDPERTTFVPSVWHMIRRIEKGLADTRGAFETTPDGRRMLAPIRQHLKHLGRDGEAFASPAAWSAWWDELVALLRMHKLPLDKILTQRTNNEAAMATLLEDPATLVTLPISTGGLETLISRHVQPLLAMRRTSFANLERTNMLFDLAVAASHGAFDDHAAVAELLREDASRHGGWTIPLRSIDDPRPLRGKAYSSLRDVTLLSQIAEQKGLL
jgi:hypothetical protein